MACTDDRCALVESAQFRGGPGAHAAQSHRAVVADVAEIRTLRPEFARAAREARIFGFLAAPLFRGARHVGTFSWYAQRSHALTEAAVPAAERACRGLLRLPIRPGG
ncbi:hypothetical protein [Saccharopolyspora rosea]|uniref:hypothetical protein n=1 Tax=Saccharopolyspora rosea TaxID=524884 RepID=UPI0021D8E2E6|nr:hypothetical protein [Saccharopolyspora rosea]